MKPKSIFFATTMGLFLILASFTLTKPNHYLRIRHMHYEYQSPHWYTMDGCEHWFDAMVEFDWDDVNNTITNVVVDDAGFVTDCHVGVPSTGYARIYLTFDGTTAHVTSLSIDRTGNPVYDDKISDPSWIQEVIDGMNDEIDAQK